ncbi:type II toxin-antitoxin system VapC family toxin [Candidatus Microgenomates bacterium]|nr:type II toxin-antitoxin system VapC family toxin [Candidatus Microgenomates bacterium]
MGNKILDTSVIAKWFCEEEGSDRAQKYLDEFGQGKYGITVPTLLFYEIGNMLLNKKIETIRVSEIMSRLQNVSFNIVDIGYEAFRKIFQNAQELSITFYDAAYVTLMQKEDAEFITADRKLYEKLHRKFSAVTLL